MFERRKILLALLEACGRELPRIDMEKLLFVFCKETGKNHYDFFPHRFGCFSFHSYLDRSILIKQGFLADAETFKLRPRVSMLRKLDPATRESIVKFAGGVKHLRGNQLVRHVYRKYPFYAVKSEIKEKILNADELKAIEQAFQPDTSKALFTIGYEGITIDEYISRLIRNNVALVVDVRRNPISMKHGFSKSRFGSYLSKAGMAYVHLPELGIRSELRKGLETDAEFRQLFQAYSRTLPNKKQKLNLIGKYIGQYGRVALTCFESDPMSCHRHKITAWLESAKDWRTPISHIT